MRKYVALSLCLSLASAAFAQNAVLNWEKTDALITSPERISFSKVATLPGGDVLVGGTVKTFSGTIVTSSRIVLERIQPNAAVVWSKRYPSDATQKMKFDDWKVLANGYVYVSGSGTNGFDSKISLADGSQANQLLIPEATETSAIAPNYMTFFTEDKATAWQDNGYDAQIRNHTIQVVTADSAWHIARQILSVDENLYAYTGFGYEASDDEVDYQTPSTFFAKDGTHVLFTGTRPIEAGVYGTEQGVAYSDFKFDNTGTFSWRAHDQTDPGLPNDLPPTANIDSWVRAGIAPNDYLEVIFSRKLESNPATTTGTAWDPTGHAQSVNILADLAQNEILNSGFEYRGVTNPFVGPVQTIEKRNTTGVSLLRGPIQADVVTRIPFEFASANLNPGTSFFFTLMPDSGGTVTNYTFSPAPQGFFADAVISNDTGEVYIVGQNNYAAGKYGGWIAKISQNAVANSESYNVPAGVFYNSSTSVLANDRFAVGIAPKIITTTHHGFLYMHADGAFGYQPAAGFTGTDVFYYSIQRPNFPPSIAEVALHVS